MRAVRRAVAELAAGRFDAAGGAGGADGSIGLNPFTSLRGQLTRDEPRELFRVQGLQRTTYLRALTLQTYVPQEGWQAGRPAPRGSTSSRSPTTTPPPDGPRRGPRCRPVSHWCAAPSSPA